MTTRTLIFVAVSMAVIMTTSFLQNLYFPAIPPQPDAQQVTAENQSEVDPSSVEQTAAELDGEAEVDPDGGEAATQTNESQDSDGSDVAKEASDAKVSGEGGSETDTSEEAVAKEDASEKPARQSELLTIGSVAADSDYQYLVTFDTAGGTIRRIELNYRGSKGRYKYRELESESGYLGELDCVDTPMGCKVRAVGGGTPAAIAGIETSDIIRSLDDEPVTSAEEWQTMLARTKPGDSIKLELADANGDSRSTVQVELTHKPMELIRPEPDFFDSGETGKSSFRTTLRIPSQLEDVWPEVDPEMMDAIWKVDAHTESGIQFSYELTATGNAVAPDDEAADQDSTSPHLKVVRTWTLEPMSDTEQQDEDARRHFHLLMKMQIENLSDSDHQVTWHLDGPLGTPTETWWYQNKIHGRTWAIGSIAGARDVIGSTSQQEFTFFGGPEIVSNAEESQPRFQWLLEPPATDSMETQQINFLSVDTQYFNVALLPTGEQPFHAYSALADVAGTNFPENTKEKKLVDCTFRLFKTVDIPAGQSWSRDFEVFAGPKEPEILAAYGLDETRSFGWFAMFSKPLCWLLKMFYYATFQFGYGIPIILLTVLVRSLMIPISRKAAINAQMMQYLQPQMKELADKYKDDMEKRGQAQRDLFKKYNYNPFGGCFMMFLQIPIFIGLYRGLSVDVALRDQPLIPGLSWCSNLSAPDQFWYWKDSLPQFMGFLTDYTGWLGPYLNILPIITCFLFVAQQKLFTPPPTDEQQEMMQKVMKYMMIFMGVLFFKVPAGLCLYFITSSLWGIAERKMLPKPELDKSKLDGIADPSDSAPDRAMVRKLAKQQQAAETAEQKRQADQDEKRKRNRERQRRLKNR